jgi:hypothetical protein
MRGMRWGNGSARAVIAVAIAACSGPEYGSSGDEADTTSTSSSSASSAATSTGSGAGGGGGVCGDGVVDPGELCDGADCDPVTCVPTEQSACFGAGLLPWGTMVALSSTPTAVNYPTCGAAQTAALGYVDTGDSPTRILRRSTVGTSARLGCAGASLGGCIDAALTDALPAHAIVWIGGPEAFATGEATVELQRVRFGSLFDEDPATDPEAFDPGGTAWTHAAGSWRLYDQVSDSAVLDSPPIDACGLSSPTLRIRHSLSSLDDSLEVNQQARVQLIFDASAPIPLRNVWTWSAAFSGSREEQASLTVIEPEVFCAGPIVLRFIAGFGKGATQIPVQWQIEEVFLSEPFVD